MAKRPSFEEKLERLNAIDPCALGDADRDAIRHALEGPEGILAGKAARLARDAGLSEWAPLLAKAFERFLDKPERDKGCAAKIAIAEILNEWESDDSELFLRGSRHVQMEPAWGPPVDTAQELRGPCAAGLARLGHPEALFELARLLMDEQVPPRRAAARILAALGREEGELLLRMKAMAPDCDADTLADCLAALMKLAPARSLPFVACYLEHSDPQVAEAAETALGESRDPAALRMLIARRESIVDAAPRRRLLLPIALSRLEDAFEYLLAVVQEENEPAALAAMEALGLFAAEAAKRRRARQAAHAGGGALQSVYRKAFGDKD
ncbi:MAG: hypothetical protein BWZ10_02965 [candidate division BRC1 bacterium ADurb.BinA364]|nr:MAG: hypothetical protein BWZ10_02965 [candidate division BRC1 bacterium ADurb.BinA364]